jgi:hypothetical protein
VCIIELKNKPRHAKNKFKTHTGISFELILFSIKRMIIVAIKKGLNHKMKIIFNIPLSIKSKLNILLTKF